MLEPWSLNYRPNLSHLRAVALSSESETAQLSECGVYPLSLLRYLKPNEIMISAIESMSICMDTL
jgi:hypothetical protein